MDNGGGMGGNIMGYRCFASWFPMYWPCKGVRVGATKSQKPISFLTYWRHFLKKLEKSLGTETVTFIGSCLNCWFRLSRPEEEVMKTYVGIFGPTSQRWLMGHLQAWRPELSAQPHMNRLLRNSSTTPVVMGLIWENAVPVFDRIFTYKHGFIW